MMIHQQPPPKPLLPQHMICHLTMIFPVTETGSDAAPAAAPEPNPVRPFLGHTMQRAGSVTMKKRGKAVSEGAWTGARASAGPRSGPKASPSRRESDQAA